MVDNLRCLAASQNTARLFTIHFVGHQIVATSSCLSCAAKCSWANIFTQKCHVRPETEGFGMLSSQNSLSSVRSPGARCGTCTCKQRLITVRCSMLWASLALGRFGTERVVTCPAESFIARHWFEHQLQLSCLNRQPSSESCVELEYFIAKHRPAAPSFDA